MEDSGLEDCSARSRATGAIDGFHFEQSTYYHVYALDFFLALCRTGEA